MVALFSALSACSRGSYLEGDELYLTGRIDRDMAKLVADIAMGGVQGVTIESLGGEIPPALEIAQRIRDHHLRVRVRRYCLSSCASIIFPSGVKREVERGAVVGLHDTSFGLHRLYEKAKSGTTLMEPPTIPALARREEQFYRTIGVDSMFLVLPYVSRGTICYSGVRQPDIIRFSVKGDYRVYVPTAATFQQFGIGYEIVDAPAGKALSPSEAAQLVANANAYVAPKDSAWEPGRVRSDFAALTLKVCS
jgi:hypothetical protein